MNRDCHGDFYRIKKHGMFYRCMWDGSCIYIVNNEKPSVCPICQRNIDADDIGFPKIRKIIEFYDGNGWIRHAALTPPRKED